MKLTIFKKFILGLLLTCQLSNANADEIDLKFSGFVSLGVSYSDNQDIGFKSNSERNGDNAWSFKGDSILGGQANISLSNKWDSVIQAVLQERSNNDWDNYLELAFLRYRPTRNWAIRMGRINNDLYLLSEYPYVGYAYPWVRPPTEYYSFTNSAGRYDGVDIEYTQDVLGGIIKIKLSDGQTSPKFGNNDDYFSVTLSNMRSLRIVYNKDEWLFRVSSLTSRLANLHSLPLSTFLEGLDNIPSNLWPQAAVLSKALNPEGQHVIYNAIGFSYDSKRWLIQGELGSTHTDWLLINSSKAAYLSAAYRVNDLSYYAGLAIAGNNGEQAGYPTLPSNLPVTLQPAIETIIDTSTKIIQRRSTKQQSITLGINWYYSNSVVFKAQLDHFHVDAFGGRLWNINNQVDIARSHNINLLSLSSSMVF